MLLKRLDEIFEPDPRSTSFVKLDATEQHSKTIDDHHEQVAAIRMTGRVPKEIRAAYLPFVPNPNTLRPTLTSVNAWRNHCQESETWAHTERPGSTCPRLLCTFLRSVRALPMPFSAILGIKSYLNLRNRSHSNALHLRRHCAGSGSLALAPAHRGAGRIPEREAAYSILKHHHVHLHQAELYLPRFFHKGNQIVHVNPLLRRDCLFI